MNDDKKSEAVPKSLKYVVLTSYVSIALAATAYCQLFTPNSAKEVIVYGLLSIFISIVTSCAILTFYSRNEEIELSDRVSFFIAQFSFIPSLAIYYLLMTLVVLGLRKIIGI